MTDQYNWVDHPTESGKAICDTDILDECLMHLKYDGEAKLSNTVNLLEASLLATKTELEGAISGLGSSIAENGLYTTTYINGNSWYREYFSDEDKTERVWLEQGGYINYGSGQFATRTINFIIPFTEICNAMGILFGPGAANDSNQGVAGWTNTTLTYVHRGWGSGVVWRAVGK